MTPRHSTRLSQAHEQEPEDEQARQRTAAHDYPEMGTVLSDRPDPGQLITVIGSRTAAAYGTEEDPRNGQYNGGELNDTGMNWAEPGEQQWTQEHSPQEEAAPPPWDPDLNPVMARLAQLEEARQFFGTPRQEAAPLRRQASEDDFGWQPRESAPYASPPRSHDELLHHLWLDHNEAWGERSADSPHVLHDNMHQEVGYYPPDHQHDSPGYDGHDPVFGTRHRATDVNGTHVDDHGDAPEHGTVPRAGAPDDYDARSTEGDGDPRWSEALPARQHGDKSAENAATVGMYPEGISAGGGPGISVGPFTARVPWTGAERGRLHGWQENPEGATWGDFVPSSDFTAVPPGEHVHHEEGQEAAGPLGQVEAAGDGAWEDHLRDAHGWGDDQVRRTRERGDRLGDMHAGLHDAGMADHQGHTAPPGPLDKYRDPGITPAMQARTRHETGGYSPARMQGTAPEMTPWSARDPAGYEQADPARFRRMMSALNVHVRIDGKPAAHEHDDMDNSLDADADSGQDRNGPEISSSQAGGGNFADSGGDGKADKHRANPQPGNDGDDAFAQPAVTGQGAAEGTGSDSPPGGVTGPQQGADPDSWPAAGADVSETGRAYTQGKDDGKVNRGAPLPAPASFSPDDGDSGGGGDQDSGSGEDPNDTGKDDEDTPFSKGGALAMFTAASASAAFRFEFTASWNDVVAKAKRIRSQGHVRIVHASAGMVIGEVRGDHDTYESGIQRPVGRRQAIQHWACGCPWASFHEKTAARSRSGRPCSHVMALQFEATARGMFGRDVTADDGGAPWAPEQVVVKSMPPYDGAPHRGRWREEWRAPVTRQASAGAPAQDCMYRHDGPCPPLRQERTAASLRYPRPDGFSSEIRPNEEFSPHSGYYQFQHKSTHVLHGYLDGQPAGKLHFSVSDDGKAHEVKMMHSLATSHGTASAMMDDLSDHVSRAGGWLNHGQRTEKGNNWWATYSEPHPEVNVHHSPPEAGWGKYWHPDSVTEDADDNHFFSGGRGEHSGPHWKAGGDWDRSSTDYDDEWTRARGLDQPSRHATGVLARAGTDPDEIGALRLLAGLRATADQSNGAWGSQNVSAHPPQKPYGATSPPQPDQDPGSYGPLAAPDPENWGSIQDDSAYQMPLTTAMVRRRAAGAPRPVPGDTVWPGAGGHGEGTVPGQAGAAGSSTEITPRDPQGIRMEEARAELRDEPEAALPETTGDEGGVTASAMGDLARESFPQAQDPSPVGQEPGMGSGDDALGPEDSSIQSIGNQQWSGAGADTDETAVPAGQPQGSIDDIVASFQRSAASGSYSGGAQHRDGDIAGAARQYLAKTADVLPRAEADELIAEGRGQRARNLGLLRLEGTHYEDEEEEAGRKGVSLDDYDDDVMFA